MKDFDKKILIITIFAILAIIIAIYFFIKDNKTSETISENFLVARFWGKWIKWNKRNHCTYRWWSYKSRNYLPKTSALELQMQ